MEQVRTQTQTQTRIRGDKQLYLSLIDQCSAANSAAGGRSRLAEWIRDNTAHPRRPGLPWEFTGHEYQLGILSDCSPHIVIQKAAQKGVSELVVRIALALMAKMTGEHGIYVLPTSGFARKFVLSRINPVISSSARLRAMISKEADSTELKQIGSCFLHIGGAQQENQAISIPARLLIRDEYSFGNPTVLQTYQSRLEHTEANERIIYDFSTPLFPEMGISESFEGGTQFVYACWHERCGQWVEVDSLRHIVIPGWDDRLEKLTKIDLSDPALRVEDAYVKCEACGGPISQANLARPDRRTWVAKYPDREIHSYHVDPLCTAAITPVAQIVSSLKLYQTVAKWVQYGLGQPFEASDSMIMHASVARALNGTAGAAGTMGPVVSGMDVGKMSYLCHGRMIGSRLHIFGLELVRQDEDNRLGVRYVNKFKELRCQVGVVDAAPDVSIVKYIQGKLPFSSVWGAYFVRSGAKASLELYEEDEAEGVVKLRRTALYDEFVADFNSGRVLIERGHRPDEELESHLVKPKRIVNEDSVGDEKAVWVSKKPDHWFSAIFYCWVAAKMLSQSRGVGASLPGKLAGKIPMRKVSQPAEPRRAVGAR